MPLLSTLQMWIYECLLHEEVMALYHHMSHDGSPAEYVGLISQAMLSQTLTRC